MNTFLTKSQIEDLRKQLATLGVRDTDLPDGDSITGEEEVAIVQKGENKKVKIKDLFEGFVPAEIIKDIKQGKSAYEVAVDNGFVGTEEEWLESLKGDPADMVPADRNTLGGIKLGYSQNNKNYPVVVDGANRAYVNVPWESGGSGPGPTGDGGYYELIFKAMTTTATPTLPQNGVALDTSTGWNHYSTNTFADNDIVWMANRFVSGTGSYGNWQGPWCISGPEGEQGVDGDSFEYIYAITASEETTPANVNSGTPSAASIARGITQPTQDDFVPVGWTDNPTGVSSETPVEWVAFRIKEHSSANRAGTWTQFFGPSLWSVYGKNGTDGDGVEYIFYAGSALPASNVLPSTWTSDEDFQEREYIREDSGWSDDPIDLEGEGYGMGTKQWVCTRKKYADTPNSDAYWHDYSDPALWSYYANDGDAGTGIVADADNETITLSLKSNGYNNALTQESHITIYDGATAKTTTVTAVSVKDSLNTSYPTQTWITYSGNTVTLNFPTDVVNLSNKQLLVTVTAEATVGGDTVERSLVLTVVGVQFGADGYSYSLVVNKSCVKKYASGTFDTGLFIAYCAVVSGRDTINTYTPTTISALGNWRFTYRYQGISETTLNVDNFSLVGIGFTGSFLELKLYYNSIAVDVEYLPVVEDGDEGGYYECIFTATDTETSPVLPTNGVPLPSGSIWSHSAANSDGTKIVWMSSRFVEGSTRGNWTGPWRISGPTGEAGVDGDAYEYVYALTADATVSPANPNSGVPATPGKVVTDDDFVPQGWTDSPTGVDETHQVEWVAIRTKSNGTWGQFTSAVPWSTWGRQGTDGDGVEYIYYATLTTPAVDPSSWDYTTSDFQNTREYIATGSGWTDDPVDLSLSTYAAGTKQYVSIRKRYADDSPHATFGSDPYWHAYSSPKLWSYKAKDGDAGIGVVADIDNDMMAVSLKSSGYNFEFHDTAEVNLFNGAAEVAGAVLLPGTLSVEDSNGTDYTQTGWISVSGDQISVDLDEDAINLSQVHLIVRVKIRGTVRINNVDVQADREVVLQIIGVHFGEDGATYKLVLGAASIRRNSLNTNYPSELGVFITKVIGLNTIQSYTPGELRAADPAFSFYVTKDNTRTSLSTNTVNTSGVLNNVTVEMYYTPSGGTALLVDREVIPVVYDGTDGDNGENAGRLDLDNENDSILYDTDGNKISGNVTTNAHLYIGAEDCTGIAESWSTQFINCSGTWDEDYSPWTVTVSNITSATASVRISCNYGGLTYTSVFSLKKLVGEVKYDLLVSPNAISYDVATSSINSPIINVKVIQTGQSGRVELSSLPSGFRLAVNGSTVAYGSGGYTFNVNTAVSAHVISLYNASNVLLDEETVPVVKGGVKGDTGLQGKIMRGVTEFTSNPVVPYEGTDDTDPTHKFYDVVFYNGYLYYCKNYMWNGVPAASINPGSNNNVWVRADNYKFVATDLLLAENAYISFLTNRGLYLKDGGGSIVGGAQGSDGVVFWAGSDDPDNAAYQAHKNGLVVAENARIRGSVEVTNLSIADGKGNTALSINGDEFSVTSPTDFRGINSWSISGQSNVSLPMQDEEVQQAEISSFAITDAATTVTIPAISGTFTSSLGSESDSNLEVARVVKRTRGGVVTYTAYPTKVGYVGTIDLTAVWNNSTSVWNTIIQNANSSYFYESVVPTSTADIISALVSGLSVGDEYSVYLVIHGNIDTGVVETIEASLVPTGSVVISLASDSSQTIHIGSNGFQVSLGGDWMFRAVTNGTNGKEMYISCRANNNQICYLKFDAVNGITYCNKDGSVKSL